MSGDKPGPWFVVLHRNVTFRINGYHFVDVINGMQGFAVHVRYTDYHIEKTICHAMTKDR